MSLRCTSQRWRSRALGWVCAWRCWPKCSLGGQLLRLSSLISRMKIKQNPSHGVLRIGQGGGHWYFAELNDLSDCRDIDSLSIWAILNVWWWNHSETISCQLPFGSKNQPWHDSICFSALMVYRTPSLVSLSRSSLSVGMKSVSAPGQVTRGGAYHPFPSWRVHKCQPLSLPRRIGQVTSSPSFLRQWAWQKPWNSICKSLLIMNNRAHVRHGLHDANGMMGLHLTLRKLSQSSSGWAIPVTRATDGF